MTGNRLPAMVMLFTGVLGFAADPPPGVKDPEKRLKETIRGVSTSRQRVGVVESIDPDQMVIVEVTEDGKEKKYRLFPIDLLREGKVLHDSFPRFAYRWQDVRVNDKIEVSAAEDKVEKRLYCLEISILRRPTGRLPASQKEDEDDAFPKFRVQNDIENGVDVDDAEIAAAYPKRTERRDRVTNALIEEARPGGLPPSLQKKLDAIRAKKKEQELKATPPKTGDKK
jgi:hypothetical protein